jgi:hypothetical protein
VRDFFKKRFNFEAAEWPSFDSIQRLSDLDQQVAESGFDAGMQGDFSEVSVRD